MGNVGEVGREVGRERVRGGRSVGPGPVAGLPAGIHGEKVTTRARLHAMSGDE